MLPLCYAATQSWFIFYLLASSVTGVDSSSDQNTELSDFGSESCRPFFGVPSFGDDVDIDVDVDVVEVDVELLICRPFVVGVFPFGVFILASLLPVETGNHRIIEL